MSKCKRILSMLLCVVMVSGLLTGCGKEELIELTVFSRLANYSGEMQGWFAKILADKFGVKVNLIPDGDGVYDTRMEAGDLGDIVVWGSDGRDYRRAVEAGFLYDWEEDNLVQDYGPYIWEHMQDALNKNKEISGKDTIYGFGHGVASTRDAHDAFMYTWDIRWDLYEQLGRPEVNNMDDLMNVLIEMKKICPTGDDGKATYGLSVWPDWDGNYVMYVKAMATSYYGYDEMGFGHYNVTNGEYYDALAEDSPYLEMLHWFNELYRNGLLDPDSMTQTPDEAGTKMLNGNVFFSIFNYAGSSVFNNEEHYAENKIMLPLMPREGSPIVSGLSTLGGNRVWSIGAKTQYPELCMEIINWLCTPEGRLTLDYGPRGLCWDYDENNKTYLTDFGKICTSDRTTMMPEEWGGATFNDGSFQINNITWAPGDVNPETGEKYAKEFWASEATPEGRCEAENQWREWSGCETVDQYMNTCNYVVDVPTSYSESDKDSQLATICEQVATCIKDGSWRAMYAESEDEYNQIVKEMREQAKAYGYDECVEFYKNEAAIRNALQEPYRK